MTMTSHSDEYLRIPMLRITFKIYSDDHKPVKWPVKHPYWCTVYDEDEDGEFSIVVSYADSKEYIFENWPEAEDLEIESVEGYTFSERLKKPE